MSDDSSDDGTVKDGELRWRRVLAHVGPIGIRGQLLGSHAITGADPSACGTTNESAVDLALDGGAVRGRDDAPGFPVRDGGLNDTNRLCQRGDGTYRHDGPLKVLHLRVIHGRHGAERASCLNTNVILPGITNVLQDLGTIGLVKPPSLPTFGERLKYARERHQFTQHQLAVASGVRQSAIGNYEIGHRKSSRNIVSLANALGVRVEWLANGTLPMEPASTSSRRALDTPWPFTVSANRIAELAPDAQQTLDNLVTAFVNGQTRTTKKRAASAAARPQRKVKL